MGILAFIICLLVIILILYIIAKSFKLIVTVGFILLLFYILYHYIIPGFQSGSFNQIANLIHLAYLMI